MSSLNSLANIKELLTERHTKKVLHDATGFYLTAQSMSMEGYEALIAITSPNPFKEGFKVLNKIEQEIELNVIYFAYGVAEFGGDLTLARGYIEKESFGESNLKVLKEIKEINPTMAEKVKDIILILAFSHRELRLIQNSIEAGAKKELATYISGIENPIEAFHFCEELFMAYNIILNLASAHNIGIEHSSLLNAKAIFIERGFDLPESLATVEYPEKKQQAPNVNVNVEQ